MNGTPFLDSSFSILAASLLYSGRWVGGLRNEVGKYLREKFSLASYEYKALLLPSQILHSSTPT